MLNDLIGLTPYFSLRGPLEVLVGINIGGAQHSVAVGLSDGSLLDELPPQRQLHCHRFERFDDSSLLLIPHCADDDGVRSIIAGTLDSNLHASEVQGIIDSLGEPVAHPDDPTGKLCRNARIVDVTELHAELLERFQVKLWLPISV